MARPRSDATTIGGSGRLQRVRLLGKALDELLHPTPTYRPIIGEMERRKIEILAFGLSKETRIDCRDAIVAFNIVRPIQVTAGPGKHQHMAWIVNPATEHTLNVPEDDLSPLDDYNDTDQTEDA